MSNNYMYIVTIFLLIGILLKGNNKNKILSFSNKYKKILFIFLIITAGFIYIYRLDSVPIGLNVDEAGMAYDAYSIAQYGVDRFLYKNPVYFINYGDGQNALYTYIVSILLKFFNTNLFIIRIPAVIFGLLSIVFTFKLLKEEKNVLFAFITIIIMIITPFFIMKSRWALESYLFLPMLIISTYYFMHAVKNRKNIYYFLSGLLFGITLYTYAVSYIIVFVFVIINIFYLLIRKKITIKNIVFFSIPLFLFAVPLIIMLLINNKVFTFEIKTSWISIPKLPNYRGDEMSLHNIKANLQNLYILKVIFTNDGCNWNSIPKYGTLYNISKLFVALGLLLSIENIIKNIYKKEYSLDIPIFVIFTSTFLLSLCLSNVNINKMNSIYFPLVYYVGNGLHYIFKKRNILGVCIICIYFIMFIDFSNYYFNKYSEDVKDSVHFLSQDFNKALEFANSKSQNKKIINIDAKSIAQPYIYILLQEKVNPFSFNKRATIENGIVLKYNNYNFSIGELNNDEIYITRYDILTNMKEKKYGKYNVYYLDTCLR